MTVNPVSVSVVIPTVGRASLYRAVRSVLDQTRAVAEVIIVADSGAPLSLPSDSRIVLLRNDSQLGPAASRQRGIDTAGGSVIALLDDDDSWHPDKLRRQLDAVSGAGPHWVASCRMEVYGPGERRRVWPRRLIRPGEPVADYLFRFTDVRLGGRLLQTSTLLFPADLARTVRWDADAGAVHDEPSWLLAAARTFPDLRIVQLSDVLSSYSVLGPSVSRHNTDLTDRYIDWGLQHLADQSRRVRGDYLCTSPVSAAVSAGSLRGIGESLRAALRSGRPGLLAVTFTAMSALRVLLRQAGSAVRR